MIKITKWLNNVSSPVVLMIDDLTNAWADMNNNGVIDLSEDWGILKDKEKSSFKYLIDDLLREFSNIKITFFVPIGPRAPLANISEIYFNSQMINCDNESITFYRNIHSNPRFELAYHGTTHGKSGDHYSDFVQEWETFHSQDEANNAVCYGKKVLEEVVNGRINGGKYCGNLSNEFSDNSIANSNFDWWCRYYNGGIINKKPHKCYGNDTNPVTAFDLKMFSDKKIVDIPSTLNGDLFNSLLEPKIITFRDLMRFILRKALYFKKCKRMNFLLKNNLVITIQEHISPARNANGIQRPNIFTDKGSLLLIFKYLAKKNVWYCTCSELSNYFRIRTTISIVENNKEFYFQHISCFINSLITLKFDKKKVKVVTPSSKIYYTNNSLITLAIEDGIYKYNYVI